MDNLAQDKLIIIKEADKRGGVVLLNVEDYHEIVKILSDNPSCYMTIVNDPTANMQNTC